MEYPPPPQYGHDRYRGGYHGGYRGDNRGDYRGDHRGDYRGDRRGDDRRRYQDRFHDRDRDRGRERDRGGFREREPRRPRLRRSPSNDSVSTGSPPPQPRKNRPTLWDVLPDGVTPGAAGMMNPAVAAAMPMAAAMPQSSQQQSQQATRHARRIYVGGLPPTGNEANIATFFSHALAAVGGNSAGPGEAVVNVYINFEKKFAFVEFRTVEECSNAMALDGIMFEGVSVRVRRPADYQPAAAALLGPAVPNPNLNLAAIGLQSGQQAATQQPAQIPDAAERVFVGGLPYYLVESQCMELLGTFGAIKSFDLVKDRENGQSKGYGFVVYQDPSVTDVAISGLNGIKMGERVLTVRRATEGQMRRDLDAATAASTGAGITSLSGATRIVALLNAVTMEELQDDEEYTEILDDMTTECKKFGTVVEVHIPRPPKEGEAAPVGVGKVVIEYTDPNSAVRCRNALHGRKFGGRSVEASFMQEDKYLGRAWDD